MLRVGLLVLGGAGCWVSAMVDEDTNGVSDVWETAYGRGLDLSQDIDQDGFTSRQEAIAGTDPHDPLDFPHLMELQPPASSNLVHRFPTVAGVRYRLMASTNLNEWIQASPDWIGPGGLVEGILSLHDPLALGGALRSRWGGVSNGGISAVRSRMDAGTPADLEDRILELEIPSSSPNMDNYGQWIRGWIVAPASGDYTFWLAGDDATQLWLSPDADPANMALAAEVSGWTSFREWTKYPSQESTPRTLVAGRVYAFEVLHREYGGGDHVSVAWTRPGEAHGIRTIIGGEHLSLVGVTLEDLMSGGNPVMFRLDSDQVDSDGDGVTDYEEHLLGLMPDLATSRPRLPDLEAALATLLSSNLVSVGASVARGYEDGPVPASFVVFRSGNIDPLTVPYTVTGTAVSGDDFTPLSGSVTFAPGQRTVTVPVLPLADVLVEPQESVTVQLQPGSGYQVVSPASATVTLDDAADLLYAARLRSPDGVPSSGSGLASLRRAGNSLSGSVSLAYGGLVSPETGSELFVSDDGLTGPVVLTLPPGQVAPQSWDFAPSGGVDRVSLLTALDEGRLWVRVRSVTWPGGELTGVFLANPETLPPPVPPGPPGSPVQATNVAEAARFLTQATFGPTGADITNLLAMTYADWIDDQMALPPTSHLPYVQARRAELLSRDGNDGWQGPRNEAWWQHGLTAPDQLRQRMAFTLSQILVISQFGALDGAHEGVTRYYDMLVAHAFGNYRDLLEEVTLSPMMGTYLSMKRNRKPDPETGHEPDENYAREIMQLFSVGLVCMQTDGSPVLDSEGMVVPTYTQDDIVELAHVFTGWGPHYDPLDPPQWSDGSVASKSSWFQYGDDPDRPMTFYPEYHDAEDRIILGGTLIPAGTNGVERLELVLDSIFQHPNVGPFIARQLIQHFVTSNPGPGYIHRVASVFNDNGSGVRGDLGATLRAVLLDPDARGTDLRDSYSYGKPAEPVLRASQLLRFLQVAPPKQGDDRFFLNLQYTFREQAPLLAPSVFNFFQPGYAQPGAVADAGLVSPEFQIFAETTAISQANFLYGSLSWGIWTPEPVSTNANAVITLDMGPGVAILDTPGLTPAEAQEDLIDYLDQVLLYGTMSEALKQDIRDAYAALPTWYDQSASRQAWRVRMALYLILNSPESFVQR